MIYLWAESDARKRICKQRAYSNLGWPTIVGDAILTANMSISDAMIGFWDKLTAKPGDPRRLRDGDTLLASVRGNELIAHTFDVALSHAEFVKRSLGSLPEDAWVGTIRKSGRQVIALNSKTFYGNQLPAPQFVQDTVRTAFR